MIRMHALTDTGKVREENQDAILANDAPDEVSRRHRGALLVVADGMGGLEHGKVASEIVVETVRAKYYALQGAAREALAEAVHEANRRVFELSHADGAGRPMGSTCTAVAVIGRRASIAHVGDSRAYHYHKGEIRQLTRDHSLVRELVDRGELDPGSLQYAIGRNVLTRGLGLRKAVDVDLIEPPELADGDLLLLTSDGLHELVEDVELLRAIEAHGDRLEDLCRYLVDLANSRGGVDNISVGAVLVCEPRGEEETAGAPSLRRAGCLVVLALLLSASAGTALLPLLHGSFLRAAGIRLGAAQRETGDSVDERCADRDRSSPAERRRPAEE
jgi:protein phosphatase